MNDREARIMALLAERSDDAPERSEPGHYYLTDMMDVAEGTATPELTAEIDAHCKECADCQMRMDSYRFVLGKPVEIEEPGLKGSLLEFAVSPPVARSRPAPAGLTPLAHDPDRWQKLLSYLRKWLPAFIKHIGLPSDSADELLSWVERQLPSIGNERFRTAFPRWVRAFARERALPDELPELPDEVTREWFTVLTFKQILEEPDEYELPEQTDFRLKASRERFPRVEDFERYSPDQTPLGPEVVSFKRDTAVLTRDRVAVAWALIEQN